MNRRVLIIVALIVSIFSATAHAGIGKFYAGGGYQQPLLYTWKKQLGNQAEKVKLWPGFGAFIEGGYRFENPRWLGLSVPVSWGMLRLNGLEWVNLLNFEAQATFHFLSPEKKVDPYAGVNAGFSYMTEGKMKNDSRSLGPNFGAVAGVNVRLVEFDKSDPSGGPNLSFHAEVPIKVILFVDDYDLSASKYTPFLFFPVRLGLIYVF